MRPLSQTRARRLRSSEKIHRPSGRWGVSVTHFVGHDSLARLSTGSARSAVAPARTPATAAIIAPTANRPARDGPIVREPPARHLLRQLRRLGGSGGFGRETSVCRQRRSKVVRLSLRAAGALARRRTCVTLDRARTSSGSHGPPTQGPDPRPRSRRARSVRRSRRCLRTLAAG